MAEYKSETLLCMIPFPEPKAVTASIRKKFPNLKIIFRESKLSVNWENHDTIQPGNFLHGE